MSGGERLLVMETSGTSMRPLVRSGSMVGVVRTPPENLCPGDVIAFRDDDTTVVHRVVELGRGPRGTLIREKGDNRLVSSWLEGNQLLGKVIWVRSGDLFRRLDPPPRPGRLKVLTLLSRLEANIFDALKRWSARLGRTAQRSGRPVSMLINFLLLPVRLPAGALLLSAFPVEGGGGRPERDYLVECLRAAAGGATLPPPPRGMDWPFLLGEAERHGLGPVLSLAAGKDIPADFASEAAKARARSALVHLCGKTTLGDVAAALGEEGLSYAILKGPVLADTLYPQEWMRPYSDVDVVVRRSDRDAAAAALSRRGYALETGGLAARFLRAGHFHLAFLPPGPGRLTVELHWGFVDRVNLNRIREGEALNRARRVTVAGLETRGLDPEDELVYLCLHAAKHGVFNRIGLVGREPSDWFCRPFTGNRLIWFLDIARCLEVRGRDLDWETIRVRAVAWNVVEELTTILGVLERLIPACGAGNALSAMGLHAASRGGRVAGLLRRQWVRSKLERAMRMRPGVLFRPVRLLVALPVLFPSPGRLLAYHRAGNRLLLPVLYLMHPFLLAVKVVRGEGN